MAAKRRSARGDTSPDKSSEKLLNERYRELKKRYLRVARENNRLRKALAVYENLMVDPEDPQLMDQQEVLTQVQMLSEDTCTGCGKGTYQELDLGHLILKTCQECGYRTKVRVPLIRD